MSIGSRRSAGKRPLATTIRPEGLAASIVCFIFGLLGCSHLGVRDSSGVPEELRTISGEDLFREGVAYAFRGDTLRAEQYLRASMQKGYSSESVVAWLVRVCVASSRYQAALSHATAYLRTNPYDWWLRFVVANIHDALGDVEGARAELELVVQAVPDRPLPHYRLAVLYRECLRNHELSTPHFRAYLRLEPGGPHAAEARAILAAQSTTEHGPQRLPYLHRARSTAEAAQ